MNKKYKKELEQAVAEYNSTQADNDQVSCVDISNELVEAGDDKVERVIAALKTKSKEVIDKFKEN